MRSGNPALKESSFEGFDVYGQSSVMTLSGTVMKTGILLTLLVGASSALAQEKVMREGQVTEKALIDALSPSAASPDAAASAADEPMRMRSFRPSVRPAAAATLAPSPPTPSLVLVVAACLPPHLQPLS